MTMTTAEELAEFIERRLAMPNVKECNTQWMFKEDNGTFHVCALGLALIGKYGGAEDAYKEFERENHATEQFPLETIHKLLCISFEMTFAIDSAHCQGISATQIIKDLRSGVYS